MAKFSVVVPIYKVEKYLPRCIDSLINQTLKDIEIILVDDGSPDGSPAICDEYAAKDNRIKVIHKKNGGVSAARNDGLKIATGDYIIFCDSDDWMEQDALESLYTKAIETGADIVVGDIYLIRGEKAIYNKYFEHEFHYTKREDMDELVKADMYQGFSPDPPVGSKTIGYGGPWNKGVKRQFLIDHNICFDPSLLGIFDDILYTAYMYAQAESIVYIHKPVYNYVDLSTSITKGYKPNSLDISDRIFKAFKALMVKFGSDGKYDKAFNGLVIRRLVESMSFYFFNDANKQATKQTLLELKKTVAKEPYATAISKIDIQRLSLKQALVVRCLRARMPIAVWVLFKISKFKNKIKGNA